MRHMNNSKNTALIMAAGSGNRMKSGKDITGEDINKVFLPLFEKPILAHTLGVFQNCEFINSIIVVTRKCDIDKVLNIKTRYNISKLETVITGGTTRQSSVLCGLDKINDTSGFVFIHDGARCLIKESTVKTCFLCAQKYGAAAPGVRVKDSLKQIDENGFIKNDIDRSFAVHIQTPQIFNAGEIIKCHKKAKQEGFLATDDTAVFTKYKGSVYVSEGDYENIKITTPEDLTVAKQIIMRKENKK